MDFLHWASILRTADVDPDQPIDLEDCSSHDRTAYIFMVPTLLLERD